jgi:hypothetical protein
MTMQARWQLRWIDERGIEQGAPWSTREEPLAAYFVRQARVIGVWEALLWHAAQLPAGTGYESRDLFLDTRRRALNGTPVTIAGKTRTLAAHIDAIREQLEPQHGTTAEPLLVDDALCVERRN